MNHATQENLARADNIQDWGYELEGAVCSICDVTFVINKGGLPRLCPVCYRDWIAPLEAHPSQIANIHIPELVIHSDQQPQLILRNLVDFIETIPYAPIDMAPDKLLERMQEFYLPTWLVDVDVEATWEAEVGFKYQVISHHERYDERTGKWSTHEVSEERIRWEPRVGRFLRKYENNSTKALDESDYLERFVEDFNLLDAQPYDPQLVHNKLIRLPSRMPQDAWSSSEMTLKGEAEQTCRQASGAEAIRQFAWNPVFRQQNWTLLLSPIYSTFYLDDQGETQVVYIDACNGKVSGSRRSSIKRALHSSGMIIGIALVIFLISLTLAAIGIVAPPLQFLAAIGILISILIGSFSLLPIGISWLFNRHQG